MKLLRYLPLIAMAFALSGVVQAHAFKLGVLDAGPGVDYYGTPLTDLILGSCGTGTTSTEGCVTIENETGSLLTSFQLTFSTSNLGPMNQTFTCGTGTLFADCSVTNLGGGNYSLVFSGGTGVPSDTNSMSMEEDQKESQDSDDSSADTFTIQENGLPYSDFASTPFTVVSETPEPSSIWLMSTGVLLLGGFFYYTRRSGLGGRSL